MGREFIGQVCYINPQNAVVVTFLQAPGTSNLLERFGVKSACNPKWPVFSLQGISHDQIWKFKTVSFANSLG